MQNRFFGMKRWALGGSAGLLGLGGLVLAGGHDPNLGLLGLLAFVLAAVVVGVLIRQACDERDQNSPPAA